GGKGGGGTTGTTNSSLTLVMVTDNNGNSAPNWGDTVTFSVSTTATTEPHVQLACSQGGATVYSAEAGFYDGYLWPWNRNMTLSSYLWTGGAADCTAVLYYGGGTLSTLKFTAGA